MNVLFFGTPSISIPFLDWLRRHHQVCGVVCRADQPAGRGQDISAPPVKVFARQHQLPVFQPVGPWTPDSINQFRHLNADIGVAVAYGRLIPADIFSAPRWGCVNIHFSLLPRYRGAAPMQWALIRGEKQTGVSIFWLDQGMDTGPLARQMACDIPDDMDAAGLRERLVDLGVGLLGDFMADVARNEIQKIPQQGEPSLAPLLTKDTGRVDWTQPARAIHNLVRGVCEWPVAWTQVNFPSGAKPLKIFKTRVVDENTVGAFPGRLSGASAAEGLVVDTGRGRLSLLDVQPEGKKRMKAWDFWNGARLKNGDHLS